MTRHSEETAAAGTDYAFGSEGPTEQGLNDRVVDGMLSLLVERGFLPEHRADDWEAFRALQSRVHEHFEVPVSSITTRMARLLFGISRAARPRIIVCAGSAWGNALVWLAGAAPSADCVGIDIDGDVTAVARRNFAAIGRPVTIIVDDARTVADQLPDIDLLLLDADDPVTGKGILAPILDSLEPVLHRGTLVLAHDSVMPTFKQDFVGYRAALVARPAQRTINVPIDRCGLEVTVL